MATQQGAVRTGAAGRRDAQASATAGGPYDAEAIDPEATVAVGLVDFGAVRVPVPAGGTAQVERKDGHLQAVHIALPEGRLSVSALAAPKSSTVWPDLVKEIAAALRSGGARVRSYTGDWGRELHATTDASTSVFVGSDGPRWMLYGVATGPTRDAVALDDQLRRVLRGTVVVRGRSPYPVRTVLPLAAPEHLVDPGPEPASDPAMATRGGAGPENTTASVTAAAEPARHHEVAVEPAPGWAAARTPTWSAGPPTARQPADDLPTEPLAPVSGRADDLSRTEPLPAVPRGVLYRVQPTGRHEHEPDTRAESRPGRRRAPEPVTEIRGGRRRASEHGTPPDPAGGLRAGRRRAVEADAEPRTGRRRAPEPAGSQAAGGGPDLAAPWAAPDSDSGFGRSPEPAAGRRPAPEPSTVPGRDPSTGPIAVPAANPAAARPAVVAASARAGRHAADPGPPAPASGRHHRPE